jgi:ornithine decarboxylase
VWLEHCQIERLYPQARGKFTRMNRFSIAEKTAETPFRELVEQYGSPLLVLDCNVLRKQYRDLQDALPGVSLFYAIKSLPERAALAALAAEGANFDIATTGEIELLRSIGADPAATIHTHPIKRDRDIRDALEFGCTTFVVDNIDELAKFEEYRSQVRILLRVSFRGKDVKSDLSRKFGCDPRDVPWMLTQAAALGIEVAGLSFHVGSQSANSEAHAAAIHACRDYFGNATLAGSEHLRILDIGGGFPADYSGNGLDLAEFCRPINEALESYPEHVRIIAEPGRVLSAPSVRSISTVIGRARRADATWYYLDDGVYGAYSGQIFDHVQYPITVFSDSENLSAGVLAGPTCDSIDVVLEDAQLPPLDIGDLVVGAMMGAYTLASASEFNSIPKPRMIALDAPVQDLEKVSLLVAEA